MPKDFGRAPVSVTGTLAGAASMAMRQSAKDRSMSGGKNLQASRVSRPHPAAAIRGTGQQVRGPDKGTG